MLTFVWRLCVFAVFSWAWLLPAARSQSSPAPLTLNDCIQLADSAPSGVRLARQQSEIANLGLKQTQAAFLPRADFGTAFTYNSPLKDNSPLQSFVALNGVREYLFVLNTTQELDLSGRLRADKQRARADLDAAHAGESIAKRDQKRAVAAAYYRLLLARHTMAALKDSIAEAESFQVRTKRLMDDGEASQADQAKALAEVNAFRQAMSAAELDASLANQDLASFWTNAVNDPLQIVDVFEPAPGASESNLAAPGTRPFANRPEFSLLDAQKRSFLSESRRIRAGLLPQANVTFQYGLDSNAVSAHDHGYAFFLSLDVPLFDWMRTLNASREFRVRSDQTDTQKAMAERAFSREYQAALDRIRNALDQISLTAQQVKLTEDDLRLSRIRFEGGEGVALDVVAAQTQLAQARISYFTAISNYWNGQADLEVASGK
jgi:outer membrane protein